VHLTARRYHQGDEATGIPIAIGLKHREFALRAAAQQGRHPADKRVVLSAWPPRVPSP
jgi:hypothetical protein